MGVPPFFRVIPRYCSILAKKKEGAGLLSPEKYLDKDAGMGYSYLSIATIFQLQKGALLKYDEKHFQLAVPPPVPVAEKGFAWYVKIGKVDETITECPQGFHLYRGRHTPKAAGIFRVQQG